MKVLKSDWSFAFLLLRHKVFETFGKERVRCLFEQSNGAEDAEYCAALMAILHRGFSAPKCCVVLEPGI